MSTPPDFYHFPNSLLLSPKQKGESKGTLAKDGVIHSISIRPVEHLILSVDGKCRVNTNVF